MSSNQDRRNQMIEHVNDVLGDERTSTKTAHAKTRHQRKPRFEWRDVLRVIQDSGARSSVASRLRDAGFSLDDFGRIREPTILAMDALVRIEDRLELQRGTARAAERLAIRDMRRRVEVDLWP